MAIRSNKMKWDSDLEVGIEIIDKRYKCLFDLANDLINTVNTGVNMRVIDILFSIVIHYAYKHFETIEVLLEKNDIGDLEKYCQLHYKFLRKLNYYKVDFYNGREGEQDLPSFIREWMADYVKDSRLKELFPEHIRDTLRTDSINSFDDFKCIL